MFKTRGEINEMKVDSRKNSNGVPVGSDSDDDILGGYHEDVSLLLCSLTNKFD
jgi:hypothetical protein